MVQQIPSTSRIDYPDSEGQPMADNTQGGRQVAKLQAKLRELGIDPEAE